MDTDNASHETKEEALSSDPQFVRFWLDAIEASGKAEKDWRDDADEVIAIYRGDDEDKASDFNILYSNIETLLPAIYNSTPSPDVRRRFGDKDPIAKTIADILERAITYSLDSYDFDSTIRSVLFDGTVAGRGVARVRYVPYMDQTGENVAYEEAVCEYVPWKHFRHGAARVWDEVPWIAFEHFLSRDELRKLAPEVADKIQLDCSTNGEKDEDENKSDIFKRARVWEIWDKESGEVVFIATGFAEQALKRDRDPLGLTGFYPIPRPVQPIMTPGNLTPVTTYSAYKHLAEELNDITARITKLVKQIRVRGGYAGGGSDLNRLASGDDGELVPFENLEMIASGQGDINKLIAWWPIEPAVKALAQLYQQREAVKQTIYEVTGISDIVRGQTQASETATAQNIKAQWGSLRIQKMQADVQRFARDLFRLKAEIFATKFSLQTLSMMTGVKVLPQAQIQQAQQAIAQAQQMQQPPPPEAVEAAKAAPAEQVEEVMRSDLLRTYRVDVESDSTIRADLSRQQEQMAGFIQGTAEYFQAAIPMAQGGVPVDGLLEIYGSFARHYKLGKQAEDALDRMTEEAREQAKQPKQPKPDPEMEKAKAELQMKQAEMQANQQAQQAKMQMDAQSKQQDAALAQEKMQADMAMRQQQADFDMGLAREKLAQEYQLKMMELNATLEIKRAESAQQMELARETSIAQFGLKQQDQERQAQLDAKAAKSKGRAQ